MPKQTPPSDDRQHSRPAGAAAAAMDAIKQLHSNGFVDGLVRRVTGQFSELDKASAEDVVADAVASLYDAIAAGRRVRKHEAWVLKAARNLAIDEHERRVGLEYAGEEIDDYSEEADETGLPVSGDDVRAAALRIARRLLPRLGQTVVVQVMEIYFEAVENGVRDVPAADVADALGVTPDVVRKSKERGFRRLDRIAETEGLTLNLSDLVTPEHEDLDEDDDDYGEE